jgi:hypothetical protein
MEISTTPGSGAKAEREGERNHNAVRIRAEYRAIFQALIVGLAILVETIHQVKQASDFRKKSRCRLDSAALFN